MNRIYVCDPITLSAAQLLMDLTTIVEIVEEVFCNSSELINLNGFHIYINTISRHWQQKESLFIHKTDRKTFHLSHELRVPNSY